jgi:hypothetical protein
MTEVSPVRVLNDNVLLALADDMIRGVSPLTLATHRFSLWLRSPRPYLMLRLRAVYRLLVPVRRSLETASFLRNAGTDCSSDRVV